MTYALRQLVKHPGFTLVAVLSLALGIGANTAVFSVLNAVLLRMLPVRAPEHLVLFNWTAEESVGPRGSEGWQQRDPATGQKISTSFSWPAFEQLRAHNATLSSIFAFAPASRLNVRIDGAAEVVGNGQLVTGAYHETLGVPAAAGRLLVPSDDEASAEAVAVISHGYWQRRFGGDPAAIGKTIHVNNVPVTLVGVTAQGFAGTMQVGESVDITLPLQLAGRLGVRTEERNSGGFWWVRIMGRLKPGVTPEQVHANLNGVFQETAKGNVSIRPTKGSGGPAQPAAMTDALLPGLQVRPGGQGLNEARRDYEKSMQLLMALVGLVLLVACANVANLLLARGAARRREIAMRLTLGANRAQVVRQLLGESVLLSLIGAAFGVLFAWWGSRALLALQPFGAGFELEASLDWRVLGFTAAVAAATGILFGLAPALRATRLNLSAEFQGGARTLGAGARSGLAKSLMVVQVALSVVLLVGAGLFVRTLQNLQSVDVGFNRERLLLFDVDAAASGLAAPRVPALYVQMRDRLAALPGAARVGFARISALGRNNWSSGVGVPGYASAGRGESVNMNAVDPDYFSTLEVPLVLGRAFTLRDQAGAPKVAIVNQAFAQKYFPNESAEGRRISLNGRDGVPDVEIVGIARDAQYSRIRTTPVPVVFIPYAQLEGASAGSATFALRYTGDQVALMPLVRAALQQVDANVPLFNVRTQEMQIDRLFAQERLFARLCSVIGLLALALAAVGLYGLMSYSVTRRTGELGLRMALGALPRAVLLMVVRESLALVLAGVAVGVVAALAASRWIESLLFGVSTTDPVTYVLVAALLGAVALVACFLPALRAARVDPMTSLRAE